MTTQNTYAVLPKGSKPSQSASNDYQRPALTCGELCRTHDGWELNVTDSYQLARVQLAVYGEPDGLDAGAVSADALKAIEKAGGFYANSRIEPCDASGVRTGQSFDRPSNLRFSQWDQLEPDKDHAFTVGFDAELLFKLAQSLGAKERVRGRSTHTVKLTFVADRKGGRPNPLRPIIVQPKNVLDGRGLLMPVRVDA